MPEPSRLPVFLYSYGIQGFGGLWDSKCGLVAPVCLLQLFI